MPRCRCSRVDYIKYTHFKVVFYMTNWQDLSIHAVTGYDSCVLCLNHGVFNKYMYLYVLCTRVCLFVSCFYLIIDKCIHNVYIKCLYWFVLNLHNTIQYQKGILTRHDSTSISVISTSCDMFNLDTLFQPNGCFPQ